MLAWMIFRRAVTLIVDNLGAALRVSALPYAILAAVTLYFGATVDMAQVARIEAAGDPEAMATLPPGALLAVMITLLAQLGAVLWISVGWHRYVLLAEGAETWLPRPNLPRMLGYFGRSILIGLAATCVFVAVWVALGPIAPNVGLVGGLILSIAMSYRLGVALPAGAVGKPIKIPQAWIALKGQSATVLGLAILTFLCSLLLQLPTMLDGAAALAPEEAVVGQVVAAGPISVIYGLVVSWMLLMLGVSVLSTLYGHFVEGRPLE